MLAGPSSQSITVKIVLFYLLIFIDIIIGSFIQASFSINASSSLEINTTFIPIQLVLNIGMIVMILVLVWQTFLLRYGLLGILFRQFLVSFIIVFIVTGLSIAERVIRLVWLINNGNNQVGIWNDGLYQVFYYLRFLSYPIYYGVLLNLSTRLAEPEYYRASKWLN